MSVIEIVLVVQIIAVALFYWIKRASTSRHKYYSDRFEFILKELIERLKN